LDLEFEPIYTQNKNTFHQVKPKRDRSFSFEPPQENFYLAPPRLPKNFDPSPTNSEMNSSKIFKVQAMTGVNMTEQ
jgi:hypothetical protein